MHVHINKLNKKVCNICDGFVTSEARSRIIIQQQVALLYTYYYLCGNKILSCYTTVGLKTCGASRPTLIFNDTIDQTKV